MNKWNKVAIKNIAIKITSGGTPSTKIKQYYNGDIPWLNTKEINFCRLTKTELSITEDGFKNSSAKWIPANSVIIAMYGATAGKACINKIPLTTNQACCNIIINNLISDYNFIYYSIKYSYDELVNLASGAAQQNLTLEIISKFTISLPPLAEQKAIAAVLGSLDDKIDLLHRQNATLERMAETLFRQWFIEEAQEDWREFSVSDFVQYKKETISPQNFPSQIFYQYSIPAFDRAKSPEVCLGSKILSNKFIVTGNMLLISKLNPQTPRVWLITDCPPSNSVCSTEFIAISPYKEENIFFLFCLFSYKPTMAALAQAASGTSGSHQRVKPKDILSIKFLSPSTEHITIFSKTVSYFFKKIKSNQQQIQSLEKLRDTLLPKLLSGEVRVRVDE